jgi:hypothetical protein
MQCMVWAVYGVCSVWRGQCIRRVQSVVCAVYGGGVCVVCGVCSGYDGCSITGVQCTIWRVVYAVYGGCSVGCVQCMVCAEYGVYSVWRRGGCSVQCVQWI